MAGFWERITCDLDLGSKYNPTSLLILLCNTMFHSAESRALFGYLMIALQTQAPQAQA